MPRLTRCVALISLFLSLTALPAQFGRPTAEDQKDMAEIQSCTLTMDNVTRFAQTMSRLKAIARNSPEVTSILEPDLSKAHNIVDQEKGFAPHPELAAVMTQQGFTVHEFLITEYTLLQATLVFIGKKSGADPAKLIRDSHSNPANLPFMEQHQTELDALRSKYPTD